jgi:phospholipid/cholesterol/gamma-HCH transport system substrate-binding protein
MALIAAGALALLMPGLFGGVYRLHAFFPQADGLSAGIPVIQRGYDIGIVESLEPLFPGRDPEAGLCPPRGDGEPGAVLPCFRATLRIRGEWPIPADSLARPGSAGLLKGDALVVVPGEAPELLAAGSRIAVSPREADLMAQLGALTDTVQSLVDRTVAPALASIQRQIETIGQLLGTEGADGAERERLAGVLGNLERLSADLERAVDPDQLAAILDTVSRIAGNLEQVTASLQGRGDELQAAVARYGELASDIRAVVKENRPALQSSLEDAQYLMQQIAASLTPILANIEEASRNLDALSRDLRDNPGVIIRGREVERETPWFR